MNSDIQRIVFNGIDITQFISDIAQYTYLSFDEATDRVREAMRMGRLTFSGSADEATGMTLDELIPEAIAEWREMRDTL